MTPTTINAVGAVQAPTLVVTQGKIVRFSMSDLLTPDDATFEDLHIRARKANMTDSGFLRVWLYQASTLIQTWDVALTDVFVTTDLAVSNSGSITNLNLLEVQIQAFATGTSVTPQISGLSFTVPFPSDTSKPPPATVVGSGSVISFVGTATSAPVVAGGSGLVITPDMILHPTTINAAGQVATGVMTRIIIGISLIVAIAKRILTPTAKDRLMSTVASGEEEDVGTLELSSMTIASDRTQEAQVSERPLIMSVTGRGLASVAADRGVAGSTADRDETGGAGERDLDGPIREGIMIER